MRRTVVTGIAAILIAVAYAPILQGMARQWWNDEDMGHGIAVPLVVAWVIWREQKRWKALTPDPSLWGFALLAAGAGLHLASAAGAGLFAGSLGFLVSIVGAVVSIGGFQYLRVWAFPLLLTLFMLPKLAVVYNQVTLPLQLLASRMAAFMLGTVGLGVIRDGNILEVGGHRVLVAEACSGIRYLLPLAFMSLAVAYLSGSKTWMRVTLLAAAIPLAIGANAFRVAASAYSPVFDAETPHMVLGMILFLASLGALVLTRSLLGRWYA